MVSCCGYLRGVSFLQKVFRVRDFDVQMAGEGGVDVGVFVHVIAESAQECGEKIGEKGRCGRCGVGALGYCGGR